MTLSPILLPHRVFVVAAALFLLAACTSAPRPPLMSPLSEARDYGYEEKDTGKDVIEVSFLGPTRSVPVYDPKRKPAVERARTEAEELALLRAAQIAISRSVTVFRVIDRRSDLNVEVQERNSGFYYPFAYRYYRPGRYYRRGFGFYSGYGYYPFYPYRTFGFRNAIAQAKASLTISLADGKEGKAYNAQATATRLGPKYANKRPSDNY